MGLFSFVGKAVKGISHVVGGVAKLGIGALKSGLVPIPLGGTAGKLLGGLLHAKAPMGHSQLKLSIPPLVLRGKTLRPSVVIGGKPHATATALRKSPVLPGGAVATRTGVTPRPLGLQSGARALTASGKPKRKRRKRRSTSSRSSYSTSHRRRASSGKRKRKLKFGSPAWRKKYLGHGRKRRKRRAA